MKKSLLILAAALQALALIAGSLVANPVDLVSFEADEALTMPLPEASPLKPAHFFARLPLSFERNEGQAEAETKFLARGRGYLLALEQTEAVMVLSATQTHESAERLGLRESSAAFAMGQANSKAPEDWRPSSVAILRPSSVVVSPERLAAPALLRRVERVDSPRPGGAGKARKESTAPRPEPAILRMRLVGANPHASISGEELLPGKFNYFIGNDPVLWRTNVATFAKVRYREVYPGIDLVYYGNEGQLEYDFVERRVRTPVGLNSRLKARMQWR